MSWSIANTGTHADVQQAVDADQHMPDGVKSAVRSALSAFPSEKHVALTTHGHINPSGESESNATITIKTV